MTKTEIEKIIKLKVKIKIDKNNQKLCSDNCEHLGKDNIPKCFIFRKVLFYVNLKSLNRCKKCLEATKKEKE